MISDDDENVMIVMFTRPVDKTVARVSFTIADAGGNVILDAGGASHSYAPPEKSFGLAYL